MKVFSTFTGIGGFELGLAEASTRTGIPAELVGYSEIDEQAISVFQAH